MELSRTKTYFFYSTVFLTGAVILALEILGTRLLAPFYGSTIYTWISLIIVTLAALSVGYWFGGRYADKHPDIDNIYRILVFGGLAILLIPIYSNFVLLRTDFLGIKYGPLAASFFMFAPALTILAMVSPYAVKVKTDALKHLGITAGTLYALSTLGSLAGGLLAGFYLLPLLSAREIILWTGVMPITLFIIWRLISK